MVNCRLFITFAATNIAVVTVQRAENSTKIFYRAMLVCNGGLRPFGGILRTADYKAGIQPKSCLQEFSRPTQCCRFFLRLYLNLFIERISASSFSIPRNAIKVSTIHTNGRASGTSTRHEVACTKSGMFNASHVYHTTIT